ncbi:hypothetical protein AMK31_31105 [Streptomyces sp. TSRI0107]|nr:hypothetical protein AMK31_31105 [Streptomyces sp. TSRI0107]
MQAVAHRLMKPLGREDGDLVGWPVRPLLALDLEAALAGILADDPQLAAEELCGRLDQATGEAPISPDPPYGRVVQPGPQQQARSPSFGSCRQAQPVRTT